MRSIAGKPEALLTTTAWWFAGRNRLKLVLFTLFALATVAAGIETTLIRPQIERQIDRGGRGSSEFERLHRLSTQVYSCGVAFLVIAGFVLPSAIRSDVIKPQPPRTSEGTAPA